MNGLIKGKEVHFDEEYQLLLSGTSCMNTGIEWESIDYHLNNERMLELSVKV